MLHTILLTKAAAAEKDIGSPGDGCKHDRHNLGNNKAKSEISNTFHPDFDSTYFMSQLAAVLREVPLARTLRGKISAGYTQPTGPHEVANPATKK